VIGRFKAMLPKERIRVMAVFGAPIAFAASLYDGVLGGATFGALAALMLFAANPAWLRRFLNAYGDAGGHGWGPGPGRDPDPAAPDPGGFGVAADAGVVVHPSLIPLPPDDVASLQALWAQADAEGHAVPTELS
jgi:hypothetical protein